MQTVLAWFDFLRRMFWLVIADTWIAKRMRDPAPKQTRLTPLPPELQQPQPTEGGFDWVVPALLALVVVIVLGILAMGLIIGWLAHSHWG